jgi:NADH-quinone oxidoreductase subunit N
MLLYGASLIYGFTGSVDFGVIASVGQGESAAGNIGLTVGLVFLLVGIAFKISAVPFHMWTPDVYQGAPTPVTAFFAAAPKLAAMALLMRVVFTAFPGIAPQWQQIIIFLSIASMLLGAFAAIGQSNIKRLMAYSSIGHIGYALVGVAANNEVGMQAVLIYLSIYLFMTLGAFACILSMRTKNGMLEEIDSLAGLAKTNLPLAFVLAMILFSMAGIPPLAGFFAKFYVFAAAIKADLLPLAIIGVLSSVVAAYYYLRVIKVMFFDDATQSLLPVERGAGFVMTIAALFVLLFVLVPQPLVNAALVAAQSLQTVSAP